MNFKEIIHRIKDIMDLRYDSDVANLLGINKTAFAERKRRNSIPKDKLEILCERESINLNWLLTGRGTARKQIDSVRENIVPYGNSDLKQIMDMLKTETPEARPHILKILQGYKDIKDGTEGLKKSARRTGK
ncbi:MAG TPA: hypothetical protein ENH31_02870 [Nitrospirae bacterium]|nr:hypothetical protein [Nitrospirota bacterium]HDK81495.1 hypothetical protein [Nitrospirota bacterium]